MFGRLWSVGVGWEQYGEGLGMGLGVSIKNRGYHDTYDELDLETAVRASRFSDRHGGVQFSPKTRAFSLR